VRVVYKCDVDETCILVKLLWGGVSILTNLAGRIKDFLIKILSIKLGIESEYCKKKSSVSGGNLLCSVTHLIKMWCDIFITFILAPQKSQNLIWRTPDRQTDGRTWPDCFGLLLRTFSEFSKSGGYLCSY